jgi:hypothetical protein
LSIISFTNSSLKDLLEEPKNDVIYIKLAY